MSTPVRIRERGGGRRPTPHILPFFPGCNLFIYRCIFLSKTVKYKVMQNCKKKYKVIQNSTYYIQLIAILDKLIATFEDLVATNNKV